MIGNKKGLERVLEEKKGEVKWSIIAGLIKYKLSLHIALLTDRIVDRYKDGR